MKTSSKACLVLYCAPLVLALAGCSDEGHDRAAFDGGGGLPPGGGGGGDGDGGDGEDDEPAPEDPPDGEPEPDDAACDAEEDTVLYLSPDDSNSMSSPVQAREAVLDGWSSLTNVAIRPWEFLNYYGFDYPAAEPGTVEVTAELWRDPEDPDGEYLLQIGVSSEHVDDGQRSPLNITLVLDTSGSMGGHSMDMLKEVCRTIAGSLGPGDTISMVTWNTANAVVLGGYSVTGPDDATLMAKVESLSAGGGTDLHGGLVAGYELAMQVYDPSRINRIVLVSDGGANVGVTDIELIAEHAEINGEDGIYMVGVGVGSASTYHDALMDQVTDAGKGASVFVGDTVEAHQVFGEDFVNTLAVAARDVQVQLDMPPGFELIEFSGEEYSEDPAEVEPQHLAPNDAMVFHQRIGTCAPDLAGDDAEITVTARYHDAITFEEREVSTTATIGELLGRPSPRLHRGAAIFAYAQALQQWQQGPDDETRTGAVRDAIALVTRAENDYPDDPELAEIRSVLEAL